MAKEIMGYKIVSLAWHILLCALRNHTESLELPPTKEFVRPLVSVKNGLLLKTGCIYFRHTALNVYI